MVLMISLRSESSFKVPRHDPRSPIGRSQSRSTGHDRRGTGRSFGWERLSCYEVLFIPHRTRVIGRKEACRSEAIVHLLEIGRACQNAIARIKRVETETIANAEFDPGAGHDLH